MSQAAEQAGRIQRLFYSAVAIQARTLPFASQADDFGTGDPGIDPQRSIVSLAIMAKVVVSWEYLISILTHT